MAGEPRSVEPAEASPLAEQTDEPSERADWRSSIEASLLLILVIGLWLVASALVLPYDKPLNP